MEVLITSAASQLSRGIAGSLSRRHGIKLTDTREVSSDLGFLRSALDHTEATNELVRGVDAIVHSGEIDPEASASEQLDFQMRCTYNLLWAAAEEGVQRFVYLSSLLLMKGYDPDLAVTERWKTLPTTELPVLCFHLGEFVCREFARERKIHVVVLRLGDITPESSSDPTSSALYMDDAVDAVEKALTAELSGWLDIFHIQSAVTDARFLTGQEWWSADDVSPPFSLGYTPRRRGKAR